MVLYNGEYIEYDVHQNCNWSQIEDAIARNKAMVGRQMGDFVLVSTNYDWYTMQQVNVVRCVLCGEEKSIANVSNFFRGKAEGVRCKCRNKKPEKQVKVDYAEYVGQTINGFKLLSYEVGKGFRTECIECGKQKWVKGNRVLSGEEKCNHKITNDYSDPKYLGMKVGNLTAIERIGRKYRFRCDCGVETIQCPGDVFNQRAVLSCGRPECEYRRIRVMGGHETRIRGLGFEFECADEMQRQGFEVEMTPSSGDYGVDFFAIIEGERVAFQCKLLKTDSVVSAVQQVYAGGRYYDCCKFVVVSPSGFSYNAELMASKLGVQLELNLQNFQLKSLEENKIDTQKVQTFSRGGLVWEIDGVSKPAEDWCREQGISRSNVINRMKRKGMDLKTALTTPKYVSKIRIEIDGVVKTKQEWCDEYGISPQLYDYRVKQGGLSPKEALTRPKAR